MLNLENDGMTITIRTSIHYIIIHNNILWLVELGMTIQSAIYDHRVTTIVDNKLFVPVGAQYLASLQLKIFKLIKV